MLERNSGYQLMGLRKVINDAYRANEYEAITNLLEFAQLDDNLLVNIQKDATNLVKHVRELRRKSTGIDSFLTEYSLSSDEGIALMCLAEALLRVPDNRTIDNLIKDKLASANWSEHKGQSSSFFVNATTWALMLTGKILAPEKAENVLNKTLMKFLNRSSETVVRKAVNKAMRIMSRQFVMGRNIEEGLERAKKKEERGYRYSYDMLGEAALTMEDAEKYYKAYEHAIITIGKILTTPADVYKNPGVSVKLSALFPRYHEMDRDRVMDELTPKVLSLAQLARKYNISFTVDAEESERLDISLDVIEKVVTDESLNDWNGFAIAVQSYQKRAFYLLDWIYELAHRTNKRMMVRLIKGAYWDSEIKKTQMQGLDDYPVFTRKVFTDISFQACAKKLLTLTDYIYPQFATHNAYSVALILNMTRAQNYRDFEFQCLHGMGSELYDKIIEDENIPCRIYAPVGSHEDLLPYLVRRLLENGANSSFVNRIVDDKAPISELVKHPLEHAQKFLDKINQNIPLPKDIFLPVRNNSKGVDILNRAERAKLKNQMDEIDETKWVAAPLVAGKKSGFKNAQKVFSPIDATREIGRVQEASLDDVALAIEKSSKAYSEWNKTPVLIRKQMIEKFAELLEEHTPEILKIACLEAGKTFNDGIAEIREAVDFCYYYANQAFELMHEPTALKGYTGETNIYELHGRGPILCISPWNFPLAIFVGQVVAALVTGNTVIAKPAEQTPIIAYLAVNLMHKAGIPSGVIQLLPGRGEIIGAKLVEDKRIKGVIFTGSTETAQIIHKTLATRGGEIIPLIAETGGQNAMVVDSSALLEQVVTDIITSSFGTAGQRCSALRVLYVQEEIYPKLLTMLKGAMAELHIGDPQWFDTDVGPVIDQDALSTLKKHVNKFKDKVAYQCKLSEECANGNFIAPHAIELSSIKDLEREVFGPVLHIIKYKNTELDKVIADINSTGYGLTLGIHSRVNSTVEYIAKRIDVGNVYINRNMIGAVVALQPFGGQGLSGTGPKAGGPLYLKRLVHEKVYTTDTTAAGGNATLMSLED